MNTPCILVEIDVVASLSGAMIPNRTLKCAITSAVVLLCYRASQCDLNV